MAPITNEGQTSKEVLDLSNELDTQKIKSLFNSIAIEFEDRIKQAAKECNISEDAITVSVYKNKIGFLFDYDVMILPKKELIKFGSVDGMDVYLGSACSNGMKEILNHTNALKRNDL